MQSDQIIEERAKDILFRNMENGDMGIQIKINNGQALLTGIVDALSEKKYVETLIKDIPGIKKIDNSLTISTDGTIDDADIIDKITHLLKEDKTTRISGIGADVKHGIVTLVGKASTLNQIHKAFDLASTVMGVKEIISKVDFDIPHDIPQDDASIVNAVEMAFAISGEVQADDIKTICHKGIVYLEGEVADSLEKQKASQWASTVFGVRKVTNNLTTRTLDNEKMH